ncbi:MAG: flagellar biosynthetic protein FliR [Rhodothermales bacterium]
MHIDPAYLFTLMLVFVRIGGLMVSAPLFSHASIPVRVRVLFSAMMAYVLVGFVPGPLPPNLGHPVAFITAILIEALTGVMLGFAAQFVFWSVQYAGEIIGYQMALALATAFNPIDGMHSNPIGRFLMTSLLLIFLLLDGHHYVLQALVYSFDAVPLAGANLAAGGPVMLEWTGTFFKTALQLASPFMITIFLVDASLGVFAKVAPQADLFSVALPVKLLVGLTMMVFFIGNFVPMVPDFIQQMFSYMMRIVGMLAT